MYEANRIVLAELFFEAVLAAEPHECLKRFMPSNPKGQTVVVGAGKGSAHLAKAFETLWDGSLSGVVVTRYGYATKCDRIKVLEAAHPIPDSAGIEATRRLKESVGSLEPSDLVVALISGGGSALLPSPPAGFKLSDEQDLNSVLLNSGAPISIMNVIRKHFSGVKGGRLAQIAHPAKVVSLVVSDVPGDDPAQVASGPTIPDAATKEDALNAISAYDMDIPQHILEHVKGEDSSPLDPGNPVFSNNEVAIIASARNSLEAAVERAKAKGFQAIILSDSVEGEARDVAKVHAAIAREIKLRDRPFKKPVILLSGGETTVTVKGSGKGGRNTEFLLSLALELEGMNDLVAIAADTDGIDGVQDNAGAFATGETVQRLRDLGHDPLQMLANNDAWSAFKVLDELFVTGPTGTNVNDFRAILIR